MKIYLFCTIFCTTVLYSVNGTDDFSYNGQHGPDHWGEEYGTCNGKHQSPIDINELNVVNKQFEKIDFVGFDSEPLKAELVNNGHTVLIRYQFEETPTISKGPLGSNIYKFVQLHFHWGQNSLEGSEDRINNKAFAAELHMVFMHRNYSSFEEAVKHNNGVTVMAFFFQVVPTYYKSVAMYEDLSKLLNNIKNANSTIEYENATSLSEMMSNEMSAYYTYIGSLTTPPCSEDVVWIDYDSPIFITEKQIDRFRHLKDFNGAPLTRNYRPIQPLNNRKVFFYKLEIKGGIPFIRNGSNKIKTGITIINIYYLVFWFISNIF